MKDTFLCDEFMTVVSLMLLDAASKVKIQDCIVVSRIMLVSDKSVPPMSINGGYKSQ